MLSQQNIKCKHIEPGSPLQNGKLERFNGIFRDKCANMEMFYQREHAQAASVAPTSDTKECPRCGETIKAKAKICQFCQYSYE